MEEDEYECGTNFRIRLTAISICAITFVNCTSVTSQLSNQVASAAVVGWHVDKTYPGCSR